MSIIRSFADYYSTEEMTREIVNIPNTSAFIKNMSLFDVNYTDQLSVNFDVTDNYVTLLPDVNRYGGNPSREGSEASKNVSFPLAYFHHADFITEQSFRGQRKVGTGSEKETLDNVVAKKMVSMKRKLDLTHEYMMFKAAQGICTTPSGTVLADMFTALGVSRTTVDFDFANVTDVGAKVRETIKSMQEGLESGGTFAGKVVIPVNQVFFEKLVSHDSVREAYLNSQSNRRYQESMTTFQTWGGIDQFEFAGAIFVSYDYSFPFKQTDGSTTMIAALPSATGEGFVIPQVMGMEMFEAWYGPNRKLTSSGGSEVFIDPYVDPEGYFVKLNMESSPLYFARKPKALVRVISST